jgi:hypothetical protein
MSGQQQRKGRAARAGGGFTPQRLSRKCKCGKFRYATREAAEDAVARLEGVGRDEERAYEAHGWWHITSKPGKKSLNRGRG